MHELNNRIILIAKHFGLEKYSDFAKKTGLSHQTVSNYMKGKQKPDAEKLGKIQQSFDSINALWLLTGKGEMLISEKKNNSNPELELKPMDDLGYGVSDPSVYEKLARTQTQALEETLTELITLKNKLAEMTNKLITVNNTNKALKEKVQELEKALNKDQNIG